MMWGIAWYWWLMAGSLAVLGILAAIAPWLARRLRARELQLALRTFKLRRELLELKFFDLARASGTPRGVRWLDIDWQESVTFGRDRQSGLLTAFVAINVKFEALEDGDMVEVEHVGLLRDAVALFHFRQGLWGTGGRALFNMNPTEALQHLATQYDPLTASSR